MLDPRTTWKSTAWFAVLSAALIGAPCLAQTFSEQGASILGAVNHNSRSASLADIDNDGDLDMLFQGAFGAQRLYRNNKNGAGLFTFTDISANLPAGLDSGSWSAAWGDYDGDGAVDVFVGQSNLGVTGDVLKNDGALSFSNTSFATGLDDPGFHQNVAWSDIDNDNDLDLVIGMEGPEKHEIYLQQDDGTFDPVGALVGFQQATGIQAYGMAIGDYDDDGDMDVYISTCKPGGNIQNHFYKNMLTETGVFTFTDVANTNGTQFLDNSYGTEFHDFDNDGDLDLFMVGADSEPSKIWRNNNIGLGTDNFTDVDTITGQPLLSDTSGDLNGARAIDYDNDGDLDLFFHDHKTANGKNNARKLYRNDGNWQFTDVTAAEGLNEINHGSYDSAWGDLDLDGDQDLVATTDSGANERIYISNASANGNNWLYVTLEGDEGNTTGIGSSVFATVNEGTPDEVTFRREANTNAGTFNQSDLPVHFGLGDATTIDHLWVEWANGTVQHLFDVAVDQQITVDIADFLEGDFNGDGTVDAADYTVWRDNFLSIGRGLPGDADNDGFVGNDDYDIWAANYGATNQPAVAVPEPTTLGLALFGLAALAPRRR